MSKELPADFASKKLSEVVRLAVDDLTKCERNPAYTINMNKWHEHNGTNCAVCLAGSVMAQTVGLSTTEGLGDISGGAFDKLVALDNVRLGDLDGAVRLWHGDRIELNEVGVFQYGTCPTAFKAEMLRRADILEAAGY